MQKKHLHLFLLLLVFIGCSHPQFTEKNPYLIDKEKFVLTYEADAPIDVLVGACEMKVAGHHVPSFRVRLYPLLTDFWDIQWENERREPLPLPHQITHRSLVALIVQDSLSELTERAIPLPDGHGVSCYLETKTKASYSVTITAAASDSLDAAVLQKVNEQLYSLTGPNGSLVMIGASETIKTALRISPAGKPPAWRFVLDAATEPQIIVTTGLNAADARREAQYYQNAYAEVVHARTMESLDKHAAFSLQTSDDRTNRIFALLATALVDATPRLSHRTKVRIEDEAQMATALFLASRERPTAVFAPAGTAYGDQQRRDNLRWGVAAYATVFDYGTVGDDSLKRIANEAITELSRLQGEYSTADLEAVADEAIKDSLMRLATAHVRLAGLMALGEEVSFVRGDAEAQGNFRRDALRAARRAQQVFALTARLYRERQSQQPSRLESVLDTTAVDVDDDIQLETTRAPVISFPDTALYLAAGARYGFNWLDDRPERLWNPRLAVGGLTWQRYLAYRFKGNLKLTASGDFDSLCTFLQDGPLPGLLTADPGRYGEPSLPVMAAAYQNLVEVYLGVRASFFEHKVFIEPRLPAGWGHTAARVPYGPGYLTLEFNFAQHYAVVGMSGMPYDVMVYLGYPLEDGGFERAQFTLEKGAHPQRIDFERDEKDNRTRLRVNEVP
jgi:hypothetical protein